MEASVSKVKLADRVAAELSQGIGAGRWPVGARLPGERELARAFGTSRVTVREAIRSLESRGVLDVQGRSGAYVRSPSSTDHVSRALSHLIAGGAHPITIRDLLEVRHLLEIEVAGFAAERRTPEDLRRIAGALADSAISLESVSGADPAPEAVAQWSRTDVDFHAAIALACHNPLIELIYDALAPAFLEQRLRSVTALPEARARSFAYHQNIFDRICVGDPEGARRAMHEHLLEARETLLRYAEIDSRLGTATPSLGAGA